MSHCIGEAFSKVIFQGQRGWRSLQIAFWGGSYKAWGWHLQQCNIVMYATLHIYIENPEREHFAWKRRGLHQAGKETEKWKRFQWKVDWDLEPFWKYFFILIIFSQTYLFTGKSNLALKGTVVVFDKKQIYYNQLLFWPNAPGRTLHVKYDLE